MCLLFIQLHTRENAILFINLVFVRLILNFVCFVRFVDTQVPYEIWLQAWLCRRSIFVCLKYYDIIFLCMKRWCSINVDNKRINKQMERRPLQMTAVQWCDAPATEPSVHSNYLGAVRFVIFGSIVQSELMIRCKLN